MQVELRTYLEEYSTHVYLRFPTFKLYHRYVIEHNDGYYIAQNSVVWRNHIIVEQNLYLFLGVKPYHDYRPIKLQTRRQVYNMLGQIFQPGFVGLRKNSDHLEKDYFVKITLPEEKRNEVVKSLVQNLVRNNINTTAGNNQFKELLKLNGILI